jgi:copper(I)-binding protein
MKSSPLPLLLAGLLLASAAHAADADHVRASHAWIRVLPGALPAGAFVTL